MALLNPIVNRALRQSEILTSEAERAYARAGNYEPLILGNVRLVLRIARRNVRSGIGQDELFDVGMLGLCEAARHFDPERGFRFGSYASWWVEAFIWRHITKNRRIVNDCSKIGRMLGLKLRDAEHRLRTELSAEPTTEQLAQALGVPIDRMARFVVSSYARDVPVGPHKREGEYEPSSLAHQHSELANARRAAQLATWRDGWLSQLDGRERLIAERRLLAEEPVTLAVLGKEFGVCRERVRQLEAGLIAKIRKYGRPGTQTARTRDLSRFRGGVR